MVQVKFYFDVACPFAYIASTRVEAVEKRTGVPFDWTPVLLGGIYEGTKAPQGKAGSASDVMPVSKKKVVNQAFDWDIVRYHVTYKRHPRHPVRTLSAQRILCSLPIADVPGLAKAYYKAYWVDNLDVDQESVLLDVAKKAGYNISPDVFNNTAAKDLLRKNTDEVLSVGGFGVPTFFITPSKKMFFGQDRLVFVEAEILSLQQNKPWSQLAQRDQLIPRVVPNANPPLGGTLEFFFDVSSPWSYLAYTQLAKIQEVGGPNLTIVRKPFLLGALFREIGTPVVPSESAPEVKKAYNEQEIRDWNTFEGSNLKWPTIFPIKTVNALRVLMIEPKVLDVLYKAAWEQDQNISDLKILQQVLTQGGFDGASLIKEITDESSPNYKKCREDLIKNTTEAKDRGLCGAPTFIYNNHLVWGQDKLGVVYDLLSGWDPEAKPGTYAKADSTYTPRSKL